MPNMPQNSRYSVGMPYVGKQHKIPPTPPSRPTKAPVPPARKPAQPQRNATVEHIKPLNPQKARVRVAAMNHKTQKSVSASKKKRAKDTLNLRDFLLGFFVGLVIFGIAAIIICSVLMGMLA